MIVFAAQESFCVEQRPEVPEPDQVLGKLKEFDKEFLSDLTVRAELLSSASRKPGVTIHLTTDGKKTAIEEMRHAPSYVTPAEKQAQPLPVNPTGRRGTPTSAIYSYDAKSNLRMMSEDDRVLHIFNAEQSARLNTTVEYLISPGGEILEQANKRNTINRYPPDSIALVLPKVEVLSCLGRGFSTSIKKVMNVEVVGEGMLRVTADGVSVMQGPGTWTLLIDPKLSYLVREASFVEAGDGKPRFLIDNEGLNEDGKFPIPLQGTFSLTLADRLVVYQLTFKHVDFKSDADFYATVEAAITGKPPANSHVHDRRTNPPTYQLIDANGKRVGGK